MLTRRQIDLVQGSFAKVLPITGLAAEAFYNRLFELAPETRALFRHDMGDQGRKLFLTLAAVVDSLDRLDHILPAVGALAVRHVGYGVRDEHYAVVGAALVDMLASVLGEDFDEEAASAWTWAYTVLSDCMLAAVRRSATAAANPAVVAAAA